jgi:hypothetical protein
MPNAGKPISFAVRGPITRADLPGLCARICTLFDRTRPRLAHCDASGVPVDAVTVDALARLQLAACRYGCKVRLLNASDELLQLLAFMGLDDVLPGDDLRVDPRWEPEEREEALGAEEERELCDPAVHDVEHL